MKKVNQPRFHLTLLFLVFETLLYLLLCFINCEHAAAIFFLNVSSLLPILFTSRCSPLLYWLISYEVLFLNLYLDDLFYKRMIEAPLPEVFCKKGVVKDFVKFTGKHLCQSRPAILLKMRLWHRCFPVNFSKSLRTPF